MRGPVVAYTSRRCMAAMMASRVLSSAQTAARPDADMLQPSGWGLPSSHSRCLVSGVESVASLPQKLSSSALDTEVWASVEPITPNW